MKYFISDISTLLSSVEIKMLLHIWLITSWFLLFIYAWYSSLNTIITIHSSALEIVVDTDIPPFVSQAQDQMGDY